MLTKSQSGIVWLSTVSLEETLKKKRQWMVKSTMHKYPTFILFNKISRHSIRIV